MSGLQRSFAKAKLAALPFEPSLPPEEAEGEDEVADEFGHLRPSPDPSQDDDSSSASSASSTATIIPSPSKNLFARPKYLPPFLPQWLCNFWACITFPFILSVFRLLSIEHTPLPYKFAFPIPKILV